MLIQEVSKTSVKMRMCLKVLIVIGNFSFHHTTLMLIFFPLKYHYMIRFYNKRIRNNYGMLFIVFHLHSNKMFPL